nr:hypothetical protein [Puniceicoccus vermicola]
MAVGRIENAPTSGTFTLSYGGNTTSSLAYDASTLDVETALNALSSVSSGGGVDVYGSAGLYSVNWRSNGARTEISATNDLNPKSGISIIEAREGDGSTASISLVRFGRVAAAYSGLGDWTEISSGEAGWTTELDLDTDQAALYVGNSKSVSADCEIALIDSSGNYTTLYQGSTNIFKNLINDAVLGSINLPSVATQQQIEADLAAAESDIDDLEANKSDVGHGHVISDTTGLQAELDGKLAQSSNLSDVENASTAFGNIKQTATEAATGVTEWATETEVLRASNVNSVVRAKHLRLKIESNGAVIVGDLTGNSRGINGLDLQSSRGAANQVASGTSSTAVGLSNTASGSESTAVGYNNAATQGGATAIGHNNTASGGNSSAIGYGAKTTTANTFEAGYWSGSTTRSSAIRMHPNGQVAMTIADSASAPTDGGATAGSEADGTLAREMVSIRRDGDDVYIDVNIGGTVKTVSLGTAV